VKPTHRLLRTLKNSPDFYAWEVRIYKQYLATVRFSSRFRIRETGFESQLYNLLLCDLGLVTWYLSFLTFKLGIIMPFPLISPSDLAEYECENILHLWSTLEM